MTVHKIEEKEGATLARIRRLPNMILWVDPQDFIEEQISKLVDELMENYNLTYEEALLKIKDFIDSWLQKEASKD